MKVIEGSIKGVIVDTQFDFKGDFVVNRQININYSKLLLKDIYPKLKVQTVLAGSYKGTCENESVNMQIESFRGRFWILWRMNEITKWAMYFLGGRLFFHFFTW